MIINTSAEVALHGMAADVEWTMERLAENNWKMTIRGLKDIKENVWQNKDFFLTDAQASATLALFIGEILVDDELTVKLYAIAEQVWQNVPQHLRIIP